MHFGRCSRALRARGESGSAHPPHERPSTPYVQSLRESRHVLRLWSLLRELLDAQRSRKSNQFLKDQLGLSEMLWKVSHPEEEDGGSEPSAEEEEPVKPQEDQNCRGQPSSIVLWSANYCLSTVIPKYPLEVFDVVMVL